MTTANQQIQQQQRTGAVAAPAKKDLRALLQSEAVKQQLIKVLPEFLTPERMMRVALTATMKNPKLMECRPESVLLALMTFAQAGIEPDGRHGHLIPYKEICQAIFDWKGLVNIAGRNGYTGVYGDIVCAHDEFNAWVEHGQKKLIHKVNYSKPRGNMIAAYTCCKKDGEFDYEVMTKEEIDNVRKRSRASGDGPWVTDYNEMAKKTVVRRMSKRWDLTVEVADQMNNDDDTPPEQKRPIYGDDPFIDVTSGTAATQETPTPQQLPPTTGNGEKQEKAPEKPKDKPAPVKEPAAVRTPEPKKEPVAETQPPQQDNPDGDLAPTQGEDAGKKFPPDDEPEPEPQDVATPPEGLQAALEVCGFRQNAGESDDATFARYIAAVRNMLEKSKVTEEQFMVFLKRNQIAKGDQKMTDLSASKFAKLAKTWATVLPEIKKC